jgi:hypothetical protein
MQPVYDEHGADFNAYYPQHNQPGYYDDYSQQPVDSVPLDHQAYQAYTE